MYASATQATAHPAQSNDLNIRPEVVICSKCGKSALYQTPGGIGFCREHKADARHAMVMGAERWASGVAQTIKKETQGFLPVVITLENAMRMGVAR